MTVPRIDAVARLVGDPSRAAMLDALMDGCARTGRELARAAHIVPSTASEHLQRLVDGALLTVIPQGRHRYYRIASSDVAHALEALMFLARQVPAHPTASDSVGLELRRARTCYAHLAGRLGVALAEALIERGAIVFGPDGGAVTTAGSALFADLGIPLEAGDPRSPVCRPCVDWSERRLHLAGRAGAALARHAFDRGWLCRNDGTRAVTVTAVGIAALHDAFGLDWNP